MPHSAPRPCRQPGCRGLARGAVRFCNEHADQELADRRRELDPHRGSSASRGYGREWRRQRVAFLAEHPLCVDPFTLHSGRIEAAVVVDHITPHRGNPTLFWDQDNWQGLCARCNAVKTARGE